MAPEKILLIEAVASAIPSITPTEPTLAPSTVTRKTGSRQWMSSDDVSINRLTRPSAHTVRGSAARPDEVALCFLSIASTPQWVADGCLSDSRQRLKRGNH